MTRFFLADLRTGDPIVDLPVMAGSWSDVLNSAESIDATMDMQDPNTIAKDLRNVATPGKAALVAADGDLIRGAGPVWVRNYDRDSATVKLTAKGIRSYFDHRCLLPLVAMTTSTGQFVVPDPADPTKTIPNPALNTNLANLSYGTIAKRWVRQAQAWTGGNIPVVFQDDEAGTFLRETIGTDFKSLGDALDQLTKLEKGIDIRFEPRFRTDRVGVEWLLRTGTIAQPQIFSTTLHKWDVTVAESPISKLSTNEDASEIASLAWLTGGRAADTVLVARSYDPTLVDNGFPLYETVDGSHSSVTIQGTLDSNAAEATLAGRGPAEVWSFEVQSAAFQAAVGDWCELRIARRAPGIPGDPFIPAGDHKRRIISISSDEKAETVKIQCAPSRVV
jgi:hypothetical protein